MTTHNLSILKYFFLTCSYLFLISCEGQEINGVELVNPINSINTGGSLANNAINTTIYRHHGILTIGTYQYLAYFSNAQNIKIIKRDISVHNGNVKTYEIAGSYDVSDTHNTISIGIDNLGYIHLSYAQHANKLKYRRSKKPLDITEWTNEIPMTGLRENHVTYPAFIIPKNNLTKSNSNQLLFFYRNGCSGSGDICIKTFNSNVMKWKDIEPCIINGSEQTPWSSNAYLNHPAIDGAGNIHLSYVWRTHFLGPKKILNNIGIDYAVSKDWGRDMANFSGAGISFTNNTG